MNEKNRLSVRQICFIYLAFTAVTKIGMLPAILANYVGEALWQAVLLNFVLDFCILLIFLHLSKKHPNQTLYEIIKNGTREWLAKITLFLFGVFFFLKTALPLFEQKLYIENTLYEILPNPIIFYPFFIVSTYASLKGLKTFARCADISLWITSAGLILALYLSISSFNAENLLPLFQKPLNSIVNASFRTLLWHADSLYFLMFLGHFDEQKHQSRNIILSFVGIALFTTFFIAVFYGIYGEISASQPFALPSMMIFSVLVNNIGRFDFIAIFLLLFSTIYAIILPIFLSTKCFTQVFNLKKATIPAVTLNAVMILNIIIFGNKFFKILSLAQNYITLFIIFMAILVPILLLFIPKRRLDLAKD